MKDYWIERLAETVDKAIEAPSERSRLAYLQLARHYWAMHLGSQRPLGARSITI